MGYTIHYEIRLRTPDDADKIIGMLSEKVSQFDWTYNEETSRSQRAIVIDTHNEECETIAFVFDGADCEGHVKYLGVEKEFLWKIFDVFWHIKPKIKKLAVMDELSLWDEYRQKNSKGPKPLFRSLTPEEKDEINRRFDIEASQHILFSSDFFIRDTYGKQRAAFFQMIRKDLSDDLSNPVDFDDIAQMLEHYPIIHGFSNGYTELAEMGSDKLESYWTIIELWVHKKLVNKSSVPVIDTVEMNERYSFSKTYSDILKYYYMMAGILYGLSAGVLGPKHSKMLALARELTDEGYCFTDDETFFRLAYSCLEFLGFYRPKELIVRRRTDC